MWCHISLFVVLLIMAKTGEIQAGKNVVCYQGTWSVYRPDAGKFSVEDIDPFLCTHLIYAFLGIQENGDLRIIDPYLDLEENGGLGNIKKFNALKLKNPTLKTLVAIGGWNEGSKRFSIVADNAEKRARFIEQIVQFIQRHGFDGVDLDWEYPGQRHNLKPNNDVANYVTLLKELKEGLEPFGYMLSAAVGSAEFSASQSYDIPAIIPYLDLINIMAYDMHGPWDKTLGINAPLYAASKESTERELQLNVDAAIKYWLYAGAPAEKLVLGVPFYGRTFTLKTEHSHKPGDEHVGRGIAGPYSREPGVLGYNELCGLLEREQWTLEWEAEQQVPYAYKGRQWLGYENKRSLQLKAQYAVEHQLAGIMIWSLESDDFRGNCTQERYPLLREINRVLGNENSSTDLVAEPQASTPSFIQDLKCQVDGSFVRDAQNCSKFFFCSAGVTFKFDCPSGLKFDYNTNSCNYAHIVKC